VDGLTRISVARAEKNYHNGNYGDRDMEEAAHLKRVAGASFGRNSTDVLFEWPAKNFVLMGRDSLTGRTFITFGVKSIRQSHDTCPFRC
jgi:hypothetical protein